MVTKRKGSGIGILVSQKWEKHLDEVFRFEEYLISAKFYFRQVEITIIVIYILPNDRSMTRKLQQLIVAMYMERSVNSQFIVMGDFNHIVNSRLDKISSSSSCSNRTLLLHRWLTNQGFGDMYRVCNPDIREYTWVRQDVQTRIDQI